jgi:hypothetical protein
MNSKFFAAAFLTSAVLLTGAASAQEPATLDQPTAGQATTEKYIVTGGRVIRYEPGRVIVIRPADPAGSADVTYTLTPDVSIPPDVKVGSDITVSTEAGPDGQTQIVKRVTTTSVTPEGHVKQTTEATRYSPDGTRQQTTTTTINGTVQAYEAGKMLTLVQPDGTRVTYLITNESRVPEGMAVGKTVTLVPVLDAKGRPVAGVVTYEIAPAPQN